MTFSPFFPQRLKNADLSTKSIPNIKINKALKMLSLMLFMVRPA